MSYNGENIMLIDPAWKRYEALKHAEPASASLAECNDCGKPITRGTYCPACAFLEMEGYVYKLNAYLKNLHERARQHINGDHSIMAGLYEGGVSWALNTYVTQMMRIAREAGEDAHAS